MFLQSFVRRNCMKENVIHDLIPSFPPFFQKIEARVSADEDLKLSDLLKYYLRESQAAKVTSSFISSEVVGLIYRFK
jgi:hypothetical protein